MATDTKLIGGRYEVGDRIARGGMGTVYRGTDTKMDRPVAIKILDTKLADDEATVARFRREMLATARLSHPNIVDVYDFGRTDDGHSFLAMELVEGTTLARVLAPGEPLETDRAIRIGLQVARAVVEAHARGVVHRDLKPSNIMLRDLHDEADVVKVLDFGIAQMLGDTTEITDLTGSKVIGTPRYVAPEQVQGDDVGPGADLYSLGVVLYEALAGRPPFESESAMALMYRHVHTPAVPLSRVAGVDVPRWLDELVTSLLKKAPTDRPQSASEVVECLRTRRFPVEVAPTKPATAAALPNADDGPNATPSSVSVTATERSRRPVVVATALLIGVGAGAVAVTLWRTPAAGTSSSTRPTATTEMQPTPSHPASKPEPTRAGPASSMNADSDPTRPSAPSRPETRSKDPSPGAASRGARPPAQVTARPASSAIAPTEASSPKKSALEIERLQPRRLRGSGER